ncbi:MAG: hypothetical protein LBI68_09975 [Azoarcus sp.]|jgi:hypothetical protein|nr:hypothetical protein [Azoarcus sp.]
MKVFHGFNELLKAYQALGVSGIHTKLEFVNNSREDISNGVFYVPENEDEDEECENTLEMWLETQTFKGVIVNKLEHHPDASRDDLLEAVIYYLERDDFLD